MPKPKFGQYIEHHVPVGQGYAHRGIVCHLLESQFVYYTEIGGHMMCLYNGEDWRKAPMPKREERQQRTVEAPAVWRDHMSRTCIVLEVTADEDVLYMPMSVDDPFHIEELSMRQFVQAYLEPIEYPVSQAARLFVEYGRHTGATDEALDALAHHTTITSEEKEMAKKKATAAKEKAPPKAKAKAAGKAKAEAGPKKPRESAAQLYRDLIRAGGKTAAQIAAQVDKKFPGKGNVPYVRWYYKALVKNGEKVTEPKGIEAAGRGRPKKKGG